MSNYSERGHDFVSVPVGQNAVRIMHETNNNNNNSNHNNNNDSGKNNNFRQKRNPNWLHVYLFIIYLEGGFLESIVMCESSGNVND